MKLSVSLPNEDVEYLDAYALSQQLGSRSAALHKAVRLLRAAELGAEYESAWDEWDADEQNRGWEQTASDGLTR